MKHFLLNHLVCHDHQREAQSYFFNSGKLLQEKLGYQGNDDNCFLVDGLIGLLPHVTQNM